MPVDCRGGTREVGDWRCASVCNECFHKLEPDMWIDEEGWKSMNPVTPFEELPKG